MKGSKYPVYGGGGATFRVDDYNREDCMIVARFGMSEECARWVSGRFFLNDSGLSVHSRRPAGLSQPFLDMQLLARQQEIYRLGRGTAQKNLKVAAFRDLRIVVPPLEEQRRIVAFLDEAFEGLDRARAHVETNLRDAKELFVSFVASTISGNSQHWPNVALPEIAQNLDRVRVPITKKDRKPGEVPYYGASGVVDYVADFLFDENLLLVSEDGANLLARTYPIAFSISGKSWVNNHAHVLRFEDRFTQEYVRLYLNSISLASYVSGMAQPKLNQAALNQISIPFPNESLRAEIVESADSVLTESERLVEVYQASVEDLGNVRQSILQRAFAGELT